MRVYVGEQDDVAGRCRVWIAHEEPRPDIREVVEVLGDLNRLMDFRRDGLVDVEYEQHRAATIARKNEIVEQIRRAEDVPRPTELAHRAIHSPDGFEWGYAGSGPADLAYSILLSEIGEPPTSRLFVRFRDDVVARLSGRSFRLPADVVWEWIETNRSLVQEELFDKIPAPGMANGPALAIINADIQTDGTSLDEASGSAVVRACEQAWRDIQTHHPELPDVVVILGTGVERGRLVKLGHWWGGRWIADGQARGEVLLAGEALHLPPAQVFEVLLHEAAHGLNAARRIPDTSRGGRYHNRRFAVTANEVLLDVESMPPYGFAATKLTEAAEERYGPTIERLGEAMRIARQIGRGVKVGVEAEGQLEGGRDGSGVDREGKRNDAVTALCECGRRLRMAPSVYQQGPVVCGRCGSAFRDGAEQRAEPEPGSAVVDRSFVERRRAALDGELAAGRDPSHLAAVLDEQRAQLEAALARASDQQVPLWPILDRLDRIDRLIDSLDVPPAEHVVTTAVQREGASELSGIDLEREDAAQVTNWYSAFGTADEAPMSPGEGQATRTRIARALLKADGTLREPRAELGETELLVGDRVVTTRDLPELGLESGVPGSVDRVDPAQQSVELEFATWGRLELSVKRMLEAGITYDYVSAAVTHTPSAELTHAPALDAHPLEPGPGW